MSAVYNPEADTAAELERLELEAKYLRRRLDQTKNEEDSRVLRRLLSDVTEEVTRLQARLQ
jgi:hypothetical protein